MDKKTEKAIKRLKSRLFIIGPWLRAKAAIELEGTDEFRAVEPLIDTLQDKDEKVRQAAYNALKNLKGAAREHLCSLWEKSRDKKLEDLIVKSGYVASEPALLTALTLFIQDKEPDLSPQAEVLEACLDDKSKVIAKNTVKYALKLKGDQGKEFLWAFSKEHPDSFVPSILHEMGWRPDDPSDRALFYFLAGDLDSYYDLDFEQAYLRYWYETGSEVIKDAVAARIRQSGDARLLSIFRTERGERKRRLTQKEVDLQIDILTKNKDYQELFNLLSQATFEQGVRIINLIKKANWIHPEPHKRELQIRLEEIVSKAAKGTSQNMPYPSLSKIYHDFKPMFTGEDNTGADDGFRKRCAEIIHLAEQGVPNLSDVVNNACGDDYWQIRMAAAAAEFLRPGTLSPANRALLEQDHVYWVQLMLKASLQKRERLVDLSPDGLEKLEEKPELSTRDKKPQDADDFFSRIKGFLPDAEREYLLTLGEYFQMEIEVSEDGSFEAKDTDVEIEIED